MDEVRDAMKNETAIQKWGWDISPKPERRSASLAKLNKQLTEACDAVRGVEKKGTNEKQRYKYVKAADIAKAIRHELFSRGIAVYPDELDFQQIGSVKTLSGGELREFKLTVDYTIAHEDEWKIVRAFGVAMDSGDKAIWKAKTGAQKYLLRTIGMIPDEKDDPEADEEVDALTSGDKKIKEYEDAFDRRESANGRIKPFKADSWLKGCRANGKTDAQIAAYLKTKFGHVQAEELTEAEWVEANAWSFSKEDIAETLKTSVKAEKAKRQKFNDSLSTLSQTTAKTEIEDETIPF